MPPFCTQRATGGTQRGKEEGTPLVEDGFMYVADTWSRVMKFDVRGGTDAIPLWRYDPKITRARTVRGIAMYGNKVFVLTYDARVIALDKETGETVEFEVLAVNGDDGTRAGAQALTGARVAGTVVEHGRGDKVIVFKKKRRKQYKRKQGHRQGYTTVKIDTIS